MHIILTITSLPQKFFNSDPFEFDDYFSITPTYQKRCSNANILTRFNIGVLGKEAMLIHDIAIHLIIGTYKLANGGLKGLFSIATAAFGQDLNYQTPIKQGVIHIGFVFLYITDFFVSPANINGAYPQHLMTKIKDIFANFLKAPNKEPINQYIFDLETALDNAHQVVEKEKSAELIFNEKLAKIWPKIGEEIREIDERKNAKLTPAIHSATCSNEISTSPYKIAYGSKDSNSDDSDYDGSDGSDDDGSYYDDVFNVSLMGSKAPYDENDKKEIALNLLPVIEKNQKSSNQINKKTPSLPPYSARARGLAYDNKRKNLLKKRLRSKKTND